MKKILIILLGLTLTIAGCGNISAEDKVEIIEKFEKMKVEDFRKNVENAKYISVDVQDYALYLKSDGIKGDSITSEEMADFFNGDEEKEAFYVTIFDGVGYFEAVYQESNNEGKIYYYVSINAGSAKLSIGKANESDTVIVTVTYELEEGELKIVNELTEEDEKFDEYENLKKDHAEDAFTFFEKAFKELDSIIN